MSRSFTTLAATWIGWVLVIVVGVAEPASAHDFGAVRVSIEFPRPDTFTIEVMVDGEHLPSGSTAGQLIADAHDACCLQFDTGDPIPLRSLSPQISHEFDSSRYTLVAHGTTPTSVQHCSFRSSLAVGETLLRFRNAGDDDPTNFWLKPGQMSEAFNIAAPERATPAWTTIGQYLTLGYTHIVPGGLDHVLFVLGLFFLSKRPRELLAQITAFTVAHSVTLGLSMYSIVRLPSSVVEPLIALSIAFVAIENILVSSLKPWRTAVVFGFGLLHGMGFAGALAEVGMPTSRFLPALLSFNVGVEAGQLTVVAAAFLSVGVWHSAKPWYRARVVVPASLAIATVGIYWTIERLTLGA